MIRKPGIVLQGKPSPQQTDYDRKVAVVTTYMEKFATIANRALTPQLYAVYVETLEDLDLQRIEKGLDAFLKGGKAWPWPGELREWCEDQI